MNSTDPRGDVRPRPRSGMKLLHNCGEPWLPPTQEGRLMQAKQTAVNPHSLEPLDDMLHGARATARAIAIALWHGELDGRQASAAVEQLADTIRRAQDVLEHVCSGEEDAPGDETDEA